MVKICAEYVWCDVNGLYRSKTKIIELKGLDSRLDVTTYPKWNYDGSSTQDAMNMEFNEITECQLYPISIYPDPFRDSDTDVIVWCYNTFLKPDIDKYESIMNNKSSKNNSNNDSNNNSNSESNKDDNSESNNDSNSESNNDSYSKSNNDYNNTRSDSDSSAVENINFHKEKNHNYNRIQKRFELGLSQLNDLDYIKVMNEYPINTNMKYAIKCFDTIFKKHEPMFGFEQEFFMINPETSMPYGFIDRITQNNQKSYFWEIIDTLLNFMFGFNDKYIPISGKQGPYYCGIGNQYAFQREFLEDTLKKSILMGLSITGMNYEVAPGQAEFQVCHTGIEACNQLHMMRYLLLRNGEFYDVNISFKSQEIPSCEFNNSGCHTNFSTKNMRINNYDLINENNNNDPSLSIGQKTLTNFVGLDYIMSVCKSFDTDICNDKDEFEYVFGKDNTDRLDGENETSEWYDYSIGIGTRCTSIRIPIGVALSGKGYLEDRRPGSNVCPYAISCWLMNQVIHHDYMINKYSYYYYNKEDREDFTDTDSDTDTDTDSDLNKNNNSGSKKVLNDNKCPCGIQNNKCNNENYNTCTNSLDSDNVPSVSCQLDSNINDTLDTQDRLETNVDDYYINNKNKINSINETSFSKNQNNSLTKNLENMNSKSLNNKPTDMSTYIGSLLFGKSSSSAKKEN